MLVNCAGRSIRRSAALATDRVHDYERMMAINYFAPVKLILGLLEQMRARGGGHVVNVSSIGVQHAPRFSAYVASKAALDAFTRVVAARAARRRHLHDDPHAARAHADDRADAKCTRLRRRSTPRRRRR